ncbi:MAG: SRPBCC domain-containing protein [Gemmatimonadota bacterium]|nr:SRPBCC domain-containing protein [Gemmatimonadota bacterium]
MTDEPAVVDAIEKTMELAATPERVWDALTDPAEVAAWFPDRVDGLEPAADGGGWLVWNEHGRYAIRTEAFEPRTRLVWRWARDSETPLGEGPTTTVEWRLEPNGRGGTTLRLREEGFLTDHARRQNVAGWEKELGELVAYLEG